MRRLLAAVVLAAGACVPKTPPGVDLMSSNTACKAQKHPYYSRIGGADELGAPVPCTLTDLLSGYLGRTGLTASGVTTRPPTDLDIQDGVRAVRFFAPKISSPSPGLAVLAPYGWRTVIRLAPAPDSPADRHRVAYLWLSVNRLTAEPRRGHELLGGRPVVQAIVERADTRVGRDSVYFLAYDGFGRLASKIYIAFPGGDTAGPGGSVSELPSACHSCHGEGPRGHLNFLDVDYWHEVTQSDHDFPLVPHALTDAGRHGTRVWQALRSLNASVVKQNERVRSPAVTAARRWVRLHRRGAPAFVAAADRGYSSSAETRAWDPGRAGERALLTELARYCYRCHGTIRFDVFDRHAVKVWRDLMVDRIHKGVMPRDRRLSPGERDRLVDLLRGAFP